MSSRTIHLDTSFLIRALVPASETNGVLRRWLADGRRLAMSAVAWTELLCGPLGAADRDLAAGVVTERVPFTERDAELAADLFNETGRRRGSLVDCMIAASASSRNAPLATLNADDFSRFEPHGLRLVDRS